MSELNRDQLVKLFEYCSKSKYCDGCMMMYNPRFLEARSVDPELVCGKVLLRWATQCINELTQAHEMLSESYDHLEKTKDDLLAEKSRFTKENASLHASCTELIQKCASLEADLAAAEAEAEKAIDIAEGNIRAEIASGGTSCHWCEDKVKADTVRKMQDRFNEVFGGMDATQALLRRTFDHIVKEMLEG